MDTLIGHTLGPYELVERLGGGGMGVVYRALHRSLGQQRAVKVLPSYLSTDQDFVERFRREAAVAASLRHPHIVLVYDVGEQDDLHYIVMELVDGRPLSDLLHPQSPLPFDRAARLLRQLGDALDYAHARGVVHRDVKPGNVLVGAGDRVTLADFGIARALEGTRLTLTGTIIGTPDYMAPEVAMGADGSPSSDLYSLGVVAYEVLTGRKPFTSSDKVAVLYAQAHAAPPSPRTFRPDFPEELERTLLRQLAKASSERFQSAGDFVAAISAVAPFVSTTTGDTLPTLSAPTPSIRAPLPSAAPAQVDADAETPPPRSRSAHVSMVGAEPRSLAGTPRPRLVVWGSLGGLAALLALAALFAFLRLTPAAPIGQGVSADPHQAPTAAVASAPGLSTPELTPAPTVTPTGTQIQATATPSIQEQLQMARAALEAKNFAAALGLLSALKTGDPDAPGVDQALYGAHVAYARALQEQNSLDESYNEYGEALKLKPGDPAALDGQKQAALAQNWKRMEAASANNDDDYAIAALEEIMRLDPNYREARQKLYLLLLAKADRMLAASDRTGAFPVLKRATELYPDRDEARQRLALYAGSFISDPGALLFFDDFDTPDSGQLSKSSSDPTHYRVGYEAGEYVIQKVDPEWAYQPAVPLPETYDDAAVSADARLTRESANRYLIVSCRSQPAAVQTTGYRLYVTPDDGKFALIRTEGGTVVRLADWRESPAIRRGNQTNRLELSCAGRTIAASINGTLVASVDDGTYRQGKLWLSAGSFPDSHTQADARFDNLVVIKR